MRFLNSFLCDVTSSTLAVSCSDLDEEAAELRSEISTVKEEITELKKENPHEDQLDEAVTEKQIAILSSP